MRPELIIDPNQIDLENIIADRDAIRRVNAQRFEMEQLTAIVHVDPSRHLVIGYKDVNADEFWVRGHLPNYPLLPGVLLCEAAAQLCSYYITTQQIMDGDFIGFGGMDNVRFRAPVRPGDRLVLVAQATRVHRRQTVCTVQGFVGPTLVYQAEIVGVPLMRKQEA